MTSLAEARLKRGLTQGEVANSLQIHQGNYAQIEARRRTLTHELATAIAAVLDVPITQIFRTTRWETFELANGSPRRRKAA